MSSNQNHDMENLEKRVAKLAQEKSNYQLMTDMMSQLLSVAGLENSVTKMLDMLMEHIGGTNICLYYCIGLTCHYTDVFGNKKLINTIDDPLVKEVFATKKPVTIQTRHDDSMMTDDHPAASASRAIPLKAGNEIIGVLKIENILLMDSSLENDLNLFFNFAGLILNNEIASFIRLQESQSQHSELSRELNQIIELTQTGTWVWNVQTGETTFNKNWAAMLGYTLRELEPITIQTWIDLTHPDDLPACNVLLQNHFEGKTDRYETEFRMKHKSGHWVWILDRGKVHEWLPDGRPLMMSGTHQDITRLKIIEENIRKSEERFRFTLDNMLEGCAILDFDWKYLYANEVHARHTRKRPEDLIGKTIIEVIEGMQNSAFYKAYLDCYENRTFQQLEASFTFADNTTAWYRVNVIPVPEGIFIMSDEITDQKLSNLALKASEEKYRLITENITEVVWILNLNQQKFTYISPSIINLRGYTVEEAMAQSLDESLTPESRKFVLESIPDSLQKFNESNGSDQIMRVSTVQQPCKNGDIIWVEISTHYMKNNQGEVEIFGVSRNITERKKVELELQQSEAILKELNITKDKFFSIIAHDLRNPFTTIIGFSEMLRDEAGELDPATITEYAGIIGRSANQTLQLLENLLDWARMQQGRINFGPKKLNLSRISNHAIDIIKETAKNKGISFSNTIPGALWINADENMITTALRNLVSNAVKFSYRGGIVEISASVSSGKVTVSVKDSGVGISAKRLNELFTLDKSESDLGTEREKGTGLGLILCKEFIEKHGGTLGVESEEGKGSTFYFTLPEAKDDSAAVQVPENHQSNSTDPLPIEAKIVNQPMQQHETGLPKETSATSTGAFPILIVEDDPVSASVLSKMLRLKFKSIDLVTSGAAAIEYCKTNPGVKVIMMDLRMAGMDGLEATRNIREFNSKVVIIAVTALVSESMMKQVKEAGCNDFIAKPYQMKDLMDMIAKHLEGQS